MNPDQTGFTLVLVAVLVGLAGYFGRQQLRTLRGLNPETQGPDERRYLRTQAYRRLCCSILMLVIAGFLIAWLFVEPHFQPDIDAASEDRKELVQGLAMYWIAPLVVLMVLLVLATMDFWATARFGLNQHRKLLADRRTMLEEQIAKRRQERNGQHRN
jgi:hypothetical protein